MVTSAGNRVAGYGEAKNEAKLQLRSERVRATEQKEKPKTPILTFSGGVRLKDVCHLRVSLPQ